MAFVSDSMSLASDSPMDESLLNDPKIIPPEGWTKDKKEMEYKLMWADSNSTLHQMIRAYELGTPKPIMSCDRHSGDIGTLFQAGTKYYMWQPDSTEIWEIITSMSLDALITWIDTEGIDSLETVQVPDWYWSKVRAEEVLIPDVKADTEPSRKSDKKPSTKSGKKSNRKPAKKLGRKK